ncbi:NADPH:quinone oxidoreductase family protein [Gordonia rubripertincta]|uniref:NADPH:quinone oxidoreductase family protein n=1 Tax=Gordonia rubripertincta TaxID=36822 RepID=A0ABT4MWC4_GORRU|nr:NADPH:quinone oxidoreductase family protein [Gordonia rubripertincta]MCZ4551309.1 NADPH:quinone oxidoreductase family protein [Gordonia rubripertincta]
MRAIVCSSYGAPEALRVEDLPSPPLKTGEVRVAVVAAAANFPDVLVIAGEYQIKVPPPFVPGSEFAGVITEVSPEVAGRSIGDRVTGTGLVGAFAEEIVVRADKVSPIADGVDERVAAAFGVAYRTAYHTLRSVARVGSGDRVIVLGAGGGVGLAAVQLGVLLGAEVTAVASSSEKLAVAQRYGAAHLINHREADLRTALRAAVPGGADAVIDPVGGALSEPALRALGRGGRFVTIGYASGDIPAIPLNLVLVKGIHIVGFQFQDIPADEFARNESELNELLVNRRVAPHVGASYALHDTAKALRLVADGHAVGKVLIEINRGEST